MKYDDGQKRTSGTTADTDEKPPVWRWRGKDVYGGEKTFGEWHWCFGTPHASTPAYEVESERFDLVLRPRT